MKTIQIIYLFTLYLLLSSCSKEDSGMAMRSETGGKGGSMARFAILGNQLYTVDKNQLRMFDISSPETPVYTDNQHIGWGIETIFPYGKNLFIGSETGMIVYSTNNGAKPQYLTEVRHIYSCDPVVVQGNYAYITLHSEGSRCGRVTNELQIIDITNIESPYLVETYNMKKPLGLGVDGHLLFVCDDGLKVFNNSDPKKLELLHNFQINAYDVIPNNGILTVTGKNGIHQYRYTNNELTLLSTIGPAS